MKKKLLFIGLFTLTLAQLGCKKVNPVEGVEQVIDATFTKTSVSYQFVDANTGAQLGLDGNTEVSISITGPNASDVVDNFGGNQVGADYGMMAVALRQGVTPSTTNQVQFTIHASANGYLPVSRSTVILQEGHQHIIVQMINTSDAPVGVKIAEDVITGVPSTGVISNTFTLSPGASSVSGTTATVTIPSGTKLMDKNSVACTGNLTATVSYSNPNEQGFNQVFPGDPFKSQLSTGDYVSFKSMGIVGTDIKNVTNGCEVKKFDNPIQMNMEVPAGMTDINGAPVVSGSVLGIYSYDEETGKWTHESDETVTFNNGSGKLEVNFEMAHLSYWQFASATTVDAQYSYNKVRFEGSCASYFNTQSDIIWEFWYNINGSTGPMAVSVTETALTQLGTEYSIASVHQSDNYNTGCKWRWYKKTNPSDYVEGNADKNQPLQTITFPSSWCPSVTSKDFTIYLTTSCPDNPNRKIKPQCPVFSWDENLGSMKFLGQMTAGELKTSTANFDLTKKHALVTFYQNKLVVLTGTLSPFDLGFRTIDGNDIDLSRSLTSTECAYLKF